MTVMLAVWAARRRHSGVVGAQQYGAAWGARQEPAIQMGCANVMASKECIYFACFHRVDSGRMLLSMTMMMIMCVCVCISRRWLHERLLSQSADRKMITSLRLTLLF